MNKGSKVPFFWHTFFTLSGYIYSWSLWLSTMPHTAITHGRLFHLCDPGWCTRASIETKLLWHFQGKNSRTKPLQNGEYSSNSHSFIHQLLCEIGLRWHPSWQVFQDPFSPIILPRSFLGTSRFSQNSKKLQWNLGLSQALYIPKSKYPLIHYDFVSVAFKFSSVCSLSH